MIWSLQTETALISAYTPLGSRKGSVIFCTQFEPKGWYSRIGNDYDTTICEAIIDRIIHKSYEMLIDGGVSMREYHDINASRKGAAND